MVLLSGRSNQNVACGDSATDGHTATQQSLPSKVKSLTWHLKSHRESSLGTDFQKRDCSCQW